MSFFSPAGTLSARVPIVPDRRCCGYRGVARETDRRMWATIVLVPVGYLLGMFPSAMLVARARGVDITKQGSGNPGASNVIRVLGWKAGAVVMLADFAKGAVAAGAGLAVGGRAAAYIVGIAAVVGHTYPLGRK